MWLEPYKDKYRAIERYIDPVTGKRKRVTTIIDKDTKAARKAAESVLKAKMEKLSAVLPSVTVGELADAYLKYQKKTIKPSSYVSTTQHISIIKDALRPDALVARLSARYVADRLAAVSNTDGQYNRNVLYFKAMINWGYVNDYVQDKNWADKIQRIRISKDVDPAACYLEKEELKRLIGILPRKDHKLMTELLVLSGLRIGEAVALLDSDVDTHIHVTKTYATGTRLSLDSPKTKSSKRDVFIQPELARVVKKIRTYQKEVQLQTGTKPEYFLPNPDGDMFHDDHYRRTVRQESRKHMDKSVHPHMLRHTHVSLLAEQGIPLDVISRRLGHADSAITRKVYFHVTSKRKKLDESMLSSVKIL